MVSGRVKRVEKFGVFVELAGSNVVSAASDCWDLLAVLRCAEGL